MSQVTPYDTKPSPLFELVVHDIENAPGFTATDAGYENSDWRYKAVTDYFFDWLPEFALKYSELEDLNAATAVSLINRAARTVYTTDKYQKRGEFGELMLHALIREVFDSHPAISKLYYKSATNETVKGFDAVHIVDTEDSLELWLGEAKFYRDINSAIRDVVEELHVHTEIDYMRDEFILISGKVDLNWPHANQFKDLISNRKSLDTVFDNICIPVLLTYESNAIASHSEKCDEFDNALKLEFEKIYEKFSKNTLPDVRIHLFLIPLAEKCKLLQAMHSKLEGMQR